MKLPGMSSSHACGQASGASAAPTAARSAPCNGEPSATIRRALATPLYSTSHSQATTPRAEEPITPPARSALASAWLNAPVQHVRLDSAGHRSRRWRSPTTVAWNLSIRWLLRSARPARRARWCCPRSRDQEHVTRAAAVRGGTVAIRVAGQRSYRARDRAGHHDQSHDRDERPPPQAQAVPPGKGRTLP